MGLGLALRRGVAAASILVLSTWVGTATISAQADDICGALTADELAAAAPGTYDQPVPFPDGCQWHGSTAAGGSVDLMLVSTTGTPEDYAVEGSQGSTVAGFPAFSMADPASDPPAAGVVVDLGGRVVLLTLTSDDATVDLAAAASGLAEAATSTLSQLQPGGDGEDAGATTTTHGDPCALFTADELSRMLGAELSAVADAGSCRWESVDAASSVSVGFDTAGLTAIRSMFPDGEDVTVADQPAYQTDQSLPGIGVSQLAVDLGPETMSLLVSSSDPMVDVAAAARDLGELAFSRGLQVLPEPATATGPCQRATPEEIALAAGLGVTLTLQDLEVACSYEGGKGKKHILIYVTTQDPSTFDDMIVSVGANEVAGPGDTNWWWTDYMSLFSRQGDLVLQVAIQPDKQMPAAKLQEMTVAVMEALLAP